VGRSEKLIEPGDSWFSPKCIYVQPRVVPAGGRALLGLGATRTPTNSEYPQGRGFCPDNPGVRAWGRSSTSERETTQTTR
jgi:hypothetical protein